MTSLRNRLIAAAESVERHVDDAAWWLKSRLGLADPLTILPMRGFGDSRRLSFRARVLEETGLTKPSQGDSAWRNLKRMIQRYDSDEVHRIRVRARFEGRDIETLSDPDGFVRFDLDVDLDPDPPAERRWREVELELPDATDREVRVVVPVLTPPRSAELGVISDIDDTVIRTGANRLLRHVRTVLFENARTRTAFPGLPAFYRALERGRRGEPINPVFYVSSSPWNLYDLFEDFLAHNDIPLGPLMLKNFGLGEGKLFKGSHDAHKVEAVETLLARYPELGFVLVGDSGQRDVEIYHEVAHRHPGRIRAVYIRDVSGEARDRRVRRMLEEIEESGVRVAYGEDLIEAAQDAAESGWIEPSAVDDVRASAQAA